MDKWNEKVKDKLSEYRFEGEVSDEKVADFFSNMDNPVQENRGSFSKQVLKIAASIALFALAGITVFRLSSTTVSTGKGEFVSVELPDGSKVDLKYESSVSFNHIGWWFDRNLQFEGEGFFSVEEGSKFEVNSKAGSTTVLGTSFNIRTRGTRYEVMCFTGRVSVQSGKEERVLTPGKATLFEGGQEIRKFNFDQDGPHWNQGEIHFEEQPFEVVMAELEKVYNISIDLRDSSILPVRYSGFFPVDDLKLALKLICDPLELDFEIDQKNVTLFLKEE